MKMTGDSSLYQFGCSVGGAVVRFVKNKHSKDSPFETLGHANFLERLHSSYVGPSD